ncbi:Phloretin 4'-O-glucosyltransferase [Linum perenne]
MAAAAKDKPHVVVVSFPAQGHLNPSLEFSTRLLNLGCRVTLFTTVSGNNLITNSLPSGLSVTTFSDGYDDPGSAWKSKDDHSKRWAQFKTRGSHFLNHLILNNADVACVVYTLLLTWAVDVARDHNLPATLLWIQPATVLDIYYYAFNGYEDLFEKSEDAGRMDLPGLPGSFSCNELPSFVAPGNSQSHQLVRDGMKEQVQVLLTGSKQSKSKSKSKVLVNTFEELEMDAIKAGNVKLKLDMIGVGPLIPMESRRDDVVNNRSDSMTWLDRQAMSSVVYVSFGTMAVISKRQKEEVGKGLLRSKRPFLWVIKKEHQKEDEDEEEERMEMEIWREEMIVEWCSQVEVLSHEAVGCFVSHCGWNSTLESICLGVPVVGFPQFSDQPTNAKLLEDVWRTGVRVVLPAADDVAVVEGDEIRRCLELVMGEGEVREQVRRNACKWKQLARDAVREGGSSHNNLKAFVDQITTGQGE